MTKRGYVVAVGFVILLAGLWLGLLSTTMATGARGTAQCGSAFIPNYGEMNQHLAREQCAAKAGNNGPVAAFTIVAGVLVMGAAWIWVPSTKTARAKLSLVK